MKTPLLAFTLCLVLAAGAEAAQGLNVLPAITGANGPPLEVGVSASSALC